ncbi:MAG: hypothetical protein SOY60_05120 [Fusobacterium gastrosuis]|uniref:hypothetical protein n=1 Tax=Fusobacterium gastrosuis TaxID=1755100 RepID=UPI00297712E1|nr:hypothetical protein [Fusobacteriaceae bacterium]MDY4011027.1 hypothetical protein [Fusobacterium gastrosuis]MDY5714141.1 hypothetical protein [Fusobacterium gastrosuis]
MQEFLVYKEKEKYKVDSNKKDINNFSEKLINLCSLYKVEGEKENIPIMNISISKFPKSISIDTDNMDIKKDTKKFHKELVDIIKESFFKKEKNIDKER